MTTDDLPRQPTTTTAPPVADSQPEMLPTDTPTKNKPRPDVKIKEPSKQQSSTIPFDKAASQESTRAHIAQMFSVVFLALVTLTLIGPFIINGLQPNTFADPVATAKELATLIAGVLGGPFGFIVGFYFKQGDTE
ncbi:MAG: hypothetical protein GF390_02630 [Candidatus Pacebacteria bacterium]|nr:hypothetical protein [Candidatus Paceibacterota bacterium]